MNYYFCAVLIPCEDGQSRTAAFAFDDEMHATMATLALKAGGCFILSTCNHEFTVPLVTTDAAMCPFDVAEICAGGPKDYITAKRDAVLAEWRKRTN